MDSFWELTHGFIWVGSVVTWYVTCCYLRDFHGIARSMCVGLGCVSALTHLLTFSGLMWLLSSSAIAVVVIQFASVALPLVVSVGIAVFLLRSNRHSA